MAEISVMPYVGEQPVSMGNIPAGRCVQHGEMPVAAQMCPEKGIQGAVPSDESCLPEAACEALRRTDICQCQTGPGQVAQLFETDATSGYMLENVCDL